MQEIVGESVAKRLIAWGVDTVFGLPGDGINGLMEGFRRHADKLKFVLVHHEETAALMATGYAKATGRLGVCAATSGPGANHLLNGLYDARISPQNMDAALTQPGVRPFDITGRPMRGWVLVTGDDLDDDVLDRWIAEAGAFVATLPPK
jgi:hypothetical protein